MKKLFSFFIILFVSLGIMINDADARRFGGGRSFGMQRSSSSYSRTMNTPTAAASPTNRWLGPLAGLAMGGLLASLFMGHGMMSGLLSWLLIGGAAMVIWSLIRSRLNPSSASYPPPHATPQYNNQFNSLNAEARNSTPYPDGFDEADFLRNAKVQFIRLQAAYDSKNLADIREFTAPEVFAEIQMQLQERQDTPNQTDVISLDAKLLDVSKEPQNTLVTVEFSGALREEVNGPIEPFKEVWHFQKNVISQKWILAGLQQS